MANRDWHKPLGIPITEWIIAALTVVLAVSSILYTVYAGRQWRVMSSQLDELRSSSHQTDQMIGLYQQQLGELQKQAEDTHALAVAAGKQAKATEGIAQRALAQVDAMNDLARAQWRSTETAITQLEIAERPRLSGMLSFTGPLVIDRGTLRLNFKMSFTNAGHTPAVQTYAEAETFALKRTVDPGAVRDHVCESAAVKTATFVPLTFKVYPGQPTTIGFSQPINKPDLDESAQRFGGYVFPAIVVCVAYRSSLSNLVGSVVYRTGFIYNVTYVPDPTSPKRMGIRVEDGSIPPERLDVHSTGGLGGPVVTPDY
jgi:hypothetical protein